MFEPVPPPMSTQTASSGGLTISSMFFATFEQFLSKTVVVTRLATVKTFHAFGMVLPAHSLDSQVIQDLHIRKETHDFLVVR